MPRQELTSAHSYDILQSAATNMDPVGGLTHGFYRYPARFSPEFAKAAIQLFSKPGQFVLDPYMGGAQPSSKHW
jgi:hypothetical protein